MDREISGTVTSTLAFLALTVTTFSVKTCKRTDLGDSVVVERNAVVELSEILYSKLCCKLIN